MPHFPVPLPGFTQSFSGRAAELEELRARLTTHRRVAICSGPGFGKTRLAIEYLHRYGASHFAGGLFWIDANKDDVGLEDQLYKIARTLRNTRPTRDNIDPLPDLKTVRQKGISIGDLLRSELRSTEPQKRILFVLDNLPERVGLGKLTRISDFCADEPPVSVLATSRDSILEDDFSPIRLPVLQPGAAVALLTFDVERRHELIFDQWATIAQWVGHFPLALDLLNRTLCGLEDPLEILKAAESHASTSDTVDQLSSKFRSKLGDQFSTSAAAGINAAFRLSFEKLPEAARQAAELLARLGPFSIPTIVTDQLSSGVVTGAALADLRRAHYLRYPNNRSSGRMHAVVGDFIRKQNSTDREHLQSASTALFVAMGLTQGTNPDLWPELNDCCLHRGDLWERAFQRTDLDENQIIFLVQSALVASVVREVQMDFKKAKELQTKALTESRARLGDGHPCTLTVRMKIVDRKKELGHTAEARAELEETLTVAKTNLRSDDPMLAGFVIMHQLMTSTEPRGEIVSASPDEAEKTSLVTKAKLTAEIGALLTVPEEWPRAIDLARKLVEKFRREFHSKHAWTLEAMSLLARILSLRGDVEEALTLQIEVCESRQTPGLESDRDRREGDLALSAALLDLADSLADLGDLEGAQRQQTKAVRLRRKFFKGKHPVTLEAESALARTLRERGQLDKSAKMLRRIVVLAERELGKTHDNTLRWIFELSQTLQKQGDTAEAARRIEETLTLLKRGGDLEQVARWTCRLADVKEAQGDWAAARELDVDALALNERLFGSEGRPTLETRLTVSQRNRRMGSLWESFQTQTELLETCRCAFGAESHVAVLTLISLAKTVQQLGDPTASHTMASEARAIAMRIVGPQHLIFRRRAKLEGQNAG